MKRNMKYIKYYPIGLIALLALFAQCSEDFFDKDPIARASTATYYTSFDAVDATVTAAYGELCSREVFDKDYFMTVGSIAADDVECGGGGEKKKIIFLLHFYFFFFLYYYNCTVC